MGNPGFPDCAWFGPGAGSIFRAREVEPEQGMTLMDSFAQTVEIRAAIARGRADCARYFWRSVVGLFRR